VLENRAPEKRRMTGSFSQASSGVFGEALDHAEKGSPISSQPSSIPYDALMSTKVQRVREELDALHASLLEKADNYAKEPVGPTRLSLADAREVLNGPRTSSRRSRASSRLLSTPCSLPAERLKSAIRILTRPRT